jgi:hypothetical protein
MTNDWKQQVRTAGNPKTSDLKIGNLIRVYRSLVDGSEEYDDYLVLSEVFPHFNQEGMGPLDYVRVSCRVNQRVHNPNKSLMENLKDGMTRPETQFYIFSVEDHHDRVKRIA